MTTISGTVKNISIAAAALFAVGLLYIGYGMFWRAAYPVHYSDMVETVSADAGIPASLIYAVIRSESGFKPTAQSSVGARGLMQITPDTLSWVRYRLGEQGAADADQLFDPASNIHYGGHTLELLIEEFGSVPTALAAYHAGWGNVTRWLADERYSDDGANLSTIPFGDTGYYVTKVLETAQMYKSIYKELP